jgi:hypothetical protein
VYLKNFINLFLIYFLLFFCGNKLICKEREASETWAQLEMIPLPKKERDKL